MPDREKQQETSRDHSNKKKAHIAKSPTRAQSMHRAFAFITVLLVFLVVCLIIVLSMLNRAGSNVSLQQTSDGQPQEQQQQDSSDASNDEEEEEESQNTVQTSIPNLINVMGMQQTDALRTIGHGATVTSTTAVNQTGNSIVSSVNVSLTQEPGDSKQGTPTVYLGLNAQGNVIEAGYSAPTSLLGYGRLSFADAITNEHIIEQTLSRTGLTVSTGNIELPAKQDYSTYGPDGHTLVQEHANFQGQGVGSNGVVYNWSARLIYDYTRANSTGNLADATHVIYVFIDAQ